MQLFSIFSIFLKNRNFKHLLKKGTAKLTVPYLQKDLFSFPKFQFYCSNASQRTSCQRIEGSKVCGTACFLRLFSCRIILTVACSRIIVILGIVLIVALRVVLILVVILIPYLSSHKIRFTGASILYDAGMKAIDIQPLLGHSTLNMTQHYI